MSRLIAYYPGKKECAGTQPLFYREEQMRDLRLEPNASFSYQYLDESICSSVSVVQDLSMVHMSYSNGAHVDWHCSGTTFKSCAPPGATAG